MGMTFLGRRISPAERRALLDDPALVGPLLFGSGNGATEPELDLDKSWHGIHHLLTGSAWEIGEGAGAAILGGTPIGGDNGYGPARLLDPDAVRAVAAGLDGVDVATLRARFDPAELAAADVYPNIWDGGAEEFDGYLAPYFTELRTFYRAAAAGGQAVLLVIT